MGGREVEGGEAVADEVGHGCMNIVFAVVSVVSVEVDGVSDVAFSFAVDFEGIFGGECSDEMVKVVCSFVMFDAEVVNNGGETDGFGWVFVLE